MRPLSGYKKKLFVYLFLIFFVFTLIIFISEYLHERRYRINALNKELNGYSEIINNYIEKHLLKEKENFEGLDSLCYLFSNKSIRVTVINLTGYILYDSRVKNYATMENHFQRPEIQQSLYNEIGTDIRFSNTTKIKYYYFAKHYQRYFVRTSVIYDIEAKEFLEPDRLFMFLIILLFFVAFATLILVTDKFGKSITTLKEFTIKASENKPFDDDFSFPANELGSIGQNIIEIYQKLNNTKEELLSEKEKLVRHLNLLDEGIAIFSKEKIAITNNSHFIQYINHISDKLVYSAENFFEIKDFNPIFGFINLYISTIEPKVINNQPTYEVLINKNGKAFTVKCIIFQDQSFEVSIDDTTKPAKLKMLKQQMTDNIAHELKTPVSSIKGFLETILNNELERPKLLEFIRRAYSQTCRLTNLIDDISMLTKIEEAASLYQIESANLSGIISNVIEDVQLKINENKIKVELNFDENLTINGNSILLYSVFRNLFDNAINYAGSNISIRIDKYMEDSKFYYFSFSDTGNGVPEQHLGRLFERFYRVDHGRDRKTGGTGLGLAIVKNAIQFHKGEINVKNKKSGGLEFLFSIGKNL